MTGTTILRKTGIDVNWTTALRKTGIDMTGNTSLWKTGMDVTGTTAVRKTGMDMKRNTALRKTGIDMIETTTLRKIGVDMDATGTVVLRKTGTGVTAMGTGDQVREIPKVNLEAGHIPLEDTVIIVDREIDHLVIITDKMAVIIIVVEIITQETPISKRNAGIVEGRVT